MTNNTSLFVRPVSVETLYIKRGHLLLESPCILRIFVLSFKYQSNKETAGPGVDRDACRK